MFENYPSSIGFPCASAHIPTAAAPTFASANPWPNLGRFAARTTLPPGPTKPLLSMLHGRGATAQLAATPATAVPPFVNPD